MKKKLKKYSAAVVVVLLAGGGGIPVQAAIQEVAGVTTRFTLKIMPPTCDIGVQNEYSLGSLTDGIKKHSPVNVTITCDDNVRTALTASVIKGKADSDMSKVGLVIRGTSVPNGSLLAFEDARGGGGIKLSGKDNDNFCEGTVAKRTCQMVPITTVTWGNANAEVEAVIGLGVIYR